MTTNDVLAETSEKFVGKAKSSKFKEVVRRWGWGKDVQYLHCKWLDLRQTETKIKHSVVYITVLPNTFQQAKRHVLRHDSSHGAYQWWFIGFDASFFS